MNPYDASALRIELLRFRDGRLWPLMVEEFKRRHGLASQERTSAIRSGNLAAAALAQGALDALDRDIMIVEDILAELARQAKRDEKPR